MKNYIIIIVFTSSFFGCGSQVEQNYFTSIIESKKNGYFLTGRKYKGMKDGVFKTYQSIDSILVREDYFYLDKLVESKFYNKCGGIDRIVEYDTTNYKKEKSKSLTYNSVSLINDLTIAPNIISVTIFENCEISRREFYCDTLFIKEINISKEPIFNIFEKVGIWKFYKNGELDSIIDYGDFSHK